MLVCRLPRSAHKAAGAASARHSLRPLSSEGHRIAKPGREIAPRECCFASFDSRTRSCQMIGYAVPGRDARSRDRQARNAAMRVVALEEHFTVPALVGRID